MKWVLQSHRVFKKSPEKSLGITLLFLRRNSRENKLAEDSKKSREKMIGNLQNVIEKIISFVGLGTITVI